MAESVREAPLTSIHRRSQQLNISETLLRRILHKDLAITPYKVQFIQDLKPIDHQMHLAKKKPSFQLKLILILAKKKNHLFR